MFRLLVPAAGRRRFGAGAARRLARMLRCSRPRPSWPACRCALRPIWARCLRCPLRRARRRLPPAAGGGDGPAGFRRAPHRDVAGACQWHARASSRLTAWPPAPIVYSAPGQLAHGHSHLRTRPLRRRVPRIDIVYYGKIRANWSTISRWRPAPNPRHPHALPAGQSAPGCRRQPGDRLRRFRDRAGTARRLPTRWLRRAPRVAAHYRLLGHNRAGFRLEKATTAAGRW